MSPGMPRHLISIGATEANPLMASIIHAPLIATPIRLTFVYVALKAAEAICLRTRYSSIPILLCMNLHLVLTQALGQAVRWGIVDKNPVKGAQPPRHGRHGTRWRNHERP